VFSEGRTPCRTAALIGEMPSSNTDLRHPVFVHLSTFSQSATTILLAMA